MPDTFRENINMTDKTIPIHRVLRQRKSIRAFSSREIASETLVSLLEAARWAPSSYNEQPWRFIVAPKSDAENFEKILSCLFPSNSVWAKKGAALILTVTKTQLSLNDKDNIFAFYDLGQAVAALSFQATAEGLYLHQMGGLDRQMARSIFEIPEGYEVASAIVLGYKGDVEALPEALRIRELAERKRNPLQEQMFSGKFGEVSGLLKEIKTIS